jgi:hypothetical protein
MKRIIAALALLLAPAAAFAQTPPYDYWRVIFPVSKCYK